MFLLHIAHIKSYYRTDSTNSNDTRNTVVKVGGGGGSWGIEKPWKKNYEALNRTALKVFPSKTCAWSLNSCHRFLLISSFLWIRDTFTSFSSFNQNDAIKVQRMLLTFINSKSCRCRNLACMSVCVVIKTWRPTKRTQNRMIVEYCSRFCA